MTTSSLTGKHIMLGICGGIAAYKSASLVRLFVKAGAEVQVIMTPAAKEFITPLTLSTLSGKPVISEFFTANTGEWHSHVDLGLWADAMVIAPATACTIAKMATGVADNMLVTSYLSARAPVFVAPAMDFDMMRHPSAVRNLATLRSYGNHIIEPREGELASHLTGKGRMEEPEGIFKVMEEFFADTDGAARPDSLKGSKVLITAGPTCERIDPVRYIGNFSTGKMGYALAEEAAARGADVTIVSGPVSITAKNPSIKVISVMSAVEMLDVCKGLFPGTDVAIMCAAVADYRPAEMLNHKIKREHSDIPQITLVRNPDIAATLGQMKRPGQTLIGFALETEPAGPKARANAVEKIRRKNLDMIVLNTLADAGAGFGTDTNKITIIRPDGEFIDSELASKSRIASVILDAIRDNN